MRRREISRFAAAVLAGAAAFCLTFAAAAADQEQGESSADRATPAADSTKTVFDDADVEPAARLLAGLKMRNAGQVCIAPSRFYVHEKAYERFVAEFCDAIRKMKVGNGLDPETNVGPLAHGRRVDTMRQLVDDAVTHGADIAFATMTNSNRPFGGFFFAQDKHIRNLLYLGFTNLITNFFIAIIQSHSKTKFK